MLARGWCCASRHWLPSCAVPLLRQPRRGLAGVAGRQAPGAAAAATRRLGAAPPAAAAGLAIGAALMGRWRPPRPCPARQQGRKTPRAVSRARQAALGVLGRGRIVLWTTAHVQRAAWEAHMGTPPSARQLTCPDRVGKRPAAARSRPSSSPGSPPDQIAEPPARTEPHDERCRHRHQVRAQGAGLSRHRALGRSHRSPAPPACRLQRGCGVAAPRHTRRQVLVPRASREAELKAMADFKAGLGQKLETASRPSTAGEAPGRAPAGSTCPIRLPAMPPEPACARCRAAAPPLRRSGRGGRRGGDGGGARRRQDAARSDQGRLLRRHQGRRRQAGGGGLLYRLVGGAGRCRGAGQHAP